MSDTSPVALTCIATLKSWAQTHHLNAHLFGSLLITPLQFDSERSDVDLMVLTPPSAVSAEGRLAFAQTLRPLVENLEIQLMRVLRRRNASEPIASVLLVTPKEIADNIHKSGVHDFFSSNLFLELGKEGVQPVTLAEQEGKPSEIIAAVQAERNKYLRSSANGAVSPETYDGPDNLPKHLLRSAAIAASIDEKVKDTNVDKGLGFLITLLAQRKDVPVGAAANEVVLRRCNATKGQRPSISPDILLFMWELLIDRSRGESSATVLKSETVVSSSPNVFHRVTTALGRVDPQALLDALSPDIVPNNVPGSLLLTVVDACWRLRNPTELLRWVEHATPKGSGLLDAEQAGILRLLSWALWETGAREKASEILTNRINNVVDPGERARWADQKATFMRFLSPEDWMIAETDYHQSLALRDAADHLGYAMTLQNLAFLYLEQGELHQAYRFMRRTAEHGRSEQYDGGNVSFLIGTLGMAWLDLIDNHPTRSARARELLRQLGLHFKTQRFGNPRRFRLVAKALGLLSDFRRGYHRQPPDDLNQSFWSRLVVEQVLVAAGKPIEAATADILQAFARPTIVPDALPRILGLLNAPPNTVRISSVATRTIDANWPVSVIAALGVGSTLGAIQALELLLRLYEAVCNAITGAPAKGQMKSSASLLNSLRTLPHLPSLLSEEVRRVTAIVEEGIPARNRIVHAATQAGDEELVSATLALTIEEAALLRQAQWTRSDPVRGILTTDISFSAVSFCHLENGEIAMTLGGTKLTATGLIPINPSEAE